jgi:hypothetical protein
VTFNLKRFQSNKTKPRRKKDPDGTEYLYSPGAGRYIKCVSEPNTPEVMAKARKRETQEDEAFARVPLWFAAVAASVTRSPAALVWVYILYCAWKAKGNSFPLGNAWLERKGVSRKVKARVLRDLAKADLLQVEQLPRKAPRITMNAL